MRTATLAVEIKKNGYKYYFIKKIKDENVQSTSVRKRWENFEAWKPS